MADIGFGTYRISDFNQSHLDALSEAIKNGIKLIDTSTNYFDGGSERAIAKVLKNFNTDIKQSIEIVSKYGYIQGSLLQEYLEKDSKLSTLDIEVVKYSNNCYHSISKEFLKDQLSRSLQRLELNFIDTYLIHNPEYYIYDAISKGIKKEIYQEEMQKRIYEAFVGLEEEVKNGRIKGYGISSNSFAKKEDEDDFLPYENLVDLAKEASKAVGNKTHNFTTIELPINIIEKQGLFCSFWAKENNLKVLSNRALNAFYKNQMYRLAQYPPSHDYYMYLNELLEFCDNDILKPVYNIINQLDENITKFNFIGDYDNFLHVEVLPYLQKNLKEIDGDIKDKIISYLDLFLAQYRDMLLFEISQKTKNNLKHFFKDCNTSIQECALKYLLNQESIDYVLVGARRVRYVYDILSLKETIR